MKNNFSSVKKKIFQRYELENDDFNSTKSTNINILLNRVKQDQKKESIKKLLFTAVTSVVLISFGVLVF
tara:strand:- start:3186 stop:3392 length:207 start_codon:yes stop_codon:yes gene_type:complete